MGEEKKASLRSESLGACMYREVVGRGYCAAVMGIDREHGGGGGRF